MSQTVSIFWFRRDLRLHDNAGLYHALRSDNAVVPIFIFDTDILDDLKEKKDKRMAFIHNTIVTLQEQLEKLDSTLHVLHGKPLDCFKELCETYTIHTVYTNTDYEPYATQRDKDIDTYLKTKHIAFHSYKDQVILGKNEVLKDNKDPYTVYTPYSKRWKATLTDFHLKAYPTQKYFKHFFKHAPKRIPSLKALGFEAIEYDIVAPKLPEATVRDYEKTRDFPAIKKGTTHLGVHLRFGTVSIRELAREAKGLNETYLNELIWREFYQMILWHFPQVVSQSFKKEYDNIKWRNNEQEFEHWCNGQTGYPIVDAGMRELNETGFMHNRVRMIVASFLTKDLLIDWRWGEAYFAEKLQDYDLSANNGNWQWAVGSGCDAAPYFRVFNPYLQTEKFDPDHTYIKKWVPEYESMDYPAPIVDHAAAKERCLKVYKQALSEKK